MGSDKVCARESTFVTGILSCPASLILVHFKELITLYMSFKINKYLQAYFLLFFFLPEGWDMGLPICAI